MEHVRDGVFPARWQKTLAAAVRGDRLRVEEIFFGTVREALREMGIQRGSVVECLRANGTSVLVRADTGKAHRVPKEKATFVCVTDIVHP